MKINYETAELELIEFDIADIVTASDPGSVPEDETPSGEYNPCGWT